MRTSISLLAALAAVTLTGCPGDDSTTSDTLLPGSSTGSPTTTTPGTTTDAPGTTTDTPGTTTGTPGTTTGTPGTSGDSTGAGGGAFELDLMGYPHEGQDVSVAVVESGTGTQLFTQTETFMGADLTIVVPDAGLVDGTDYDVYWYVDVNGNMACDAPPDDHSWEMIAQTADAAGLALNHTHDANWVDVCSNFP